MKRFPSSTRPHTVHDHIRDEAIGWLVGFCEGEIDADGRKRFERWLKASPQHVQAYLQVSTLWEAAGRLNSTRKMQIDELVRRAATEQNVLTLQPAADRIRSFGASRLRKGVLGRPAALAASLLVVMLLGVAGLWWQNHRSLVYATVVGEERTLTLSDSSTVVLDARSKIRVRYTQALRTIDLLEGQALFRVTHNPARPFIVTTNDATIRDVGTQFDVRRNGASTVVTVMEGQVATFGGAGGSMASGGPIRAIYVSAGQQVVVAPRLVFRPVRVNVAAATAWTEGKLVFDATPLSDVIRDFNRYSLKPLTIDDPQLLSLHVSGTFDARNSAQIIQFLSERFGLVAHESTDGIRLARH
jgi:transmembrane sensor